MPSSGMLRRVALVTTDVSETGFFFRLEVEHTDVGDIDPPPRRKWGRETRVQGHRPTAAR
jgi:hypothetical protein